MPKPSSEKITTAILRTAKTHCHSRRPFLVSQIIDIPLILPMANTISVVKRQLGLLFNILQSEERQAMERFISMIRDNSEDT